MRAVCDKLAHAGREIVLNSTPAGATLRMPPLHRQLVCLNVNPGRILVKTIGWSKQPGRSNRRGAEAPRSIRSVRKSAAPTQDRTRVSIPQADACDPVIPSLQDLVQKYIDLFN